MPTDRERILRALHDGPVTPIMFQAPACDGGKPILRVAARIKDLRDEGHNIPPAGRMSNGCAIYRLEQDGVTTEAEPKASPTSAIPLEPLFDTPRTSSMYDVKAA